MEPTYGPEEFERYRRGPPESEQRLRPDHQGHGPSRRARPWIAAAIAALVVAAFVVIVVTGGGEDSPSPAGIVVDGPP